MYARYVWVALEARGRYWVPWISSYIWVVRNPLLRALGAKLRLPAARAAKGLNGQALASL